jgi:hypothetical protein
VYSGPYAALADHFAALAAEPHVTPRAGGGVGVLESVLETLGGAEAAERGRVLVAAFAASPAGRADAALRAHEQERAAGRGEGMGPCGETQWCIGCHTSFQDRLCFHRSLAHTQATGALLACDWGEVRWGVVLWVVRWIT